MKSEKIKESNLKKYGVEHLSQHPEFMLKLKKENVEKYGYAFPFQSDKIQEKIKESNLEKYGVVSSMQTTAVFVKSAQAAFRKKEYMWKTGEISYIQGFEPIVLKELEDMGYSYDEIKTCQNDMPEVWYFFKGRRRRYYPDFFIPTENIIIEVKSHWTLDIDFEKNQAKFDAVKKLGYVFKLEIR